MPPKLPEGKKKRDRQRSVQGWFDPDQPIEKWVLDVVDFFMQQGLTQKEIVIRAFAAMGQLEANGIPIKMPKSKSRTDEAITQIQSVVNGIYEILQSGQFQAVSHENAEIFQRFSDMRWQLNEIEDGIADQYRSLGEMD